MAITLILGGTKTGKTTYAENLAKKIETQKSCTVHYVATAQIIDSEMRDRIAKHRAGRPSHWITVEEPLNVAKALSELEGEYSVVLLDCLTLLMTNLIFEEGEDCTREEAQKAVFNQLDEIISQMEKSSRDLIIISNQVENGLVSEHAWARMFQDIAGMAHQRMASAADDVYMMNAGLALKLK